MTGEKKKMPARSQSPGAFLRQCTEPTPASASLGTPLGKKDMFLRLISEPGPEGGERNSLFQRARQTVESRIRTKSAFNLVTALQEEAVKEKKQPPWMLIAAIVVFNVVGKVGDAVGPAIVRSYPIGLLFLNASNTHCILTTTSVSFIPWLLICVFRRFAEDPLYFYAGWKYREACLTMLRDYSPDMADGLDKAEDMFKQNLYFAVVLNPGATVCSLAGASRMNPVAFFTLNVGSTAGQLLIMRYVCSQFPGRIDDALDVISQYMKIFLAIMVGITLIGALPMLRKKKEDEKKE